MSRIRQFFADAAKQIKVYPRSIAKAIDVHGGGTVQDYLDGTKKVSKAVNADGISRLGLDGGFLPLAKDCLSLSASENGKLETANNYSNGIEKTKNCPVANFIGTKQQFVMADGWGIVILHEMHPIAGRTWMNVYNQKWRGWQGFSDDISVINAAVTQAVEYLNVHGMNMGSTSNPNRPINFFSSDGTHYQLHSNNGAFWIHKFNASGQVIAIPFTIDANGYSYVDNAKKVPWSGITGAPFSNLWFSNLTLNYINSTTLRGVVRVSSDWLGARVFLSNHYVYGTAVNNVQTIYGYVDEYNVLNIDAYGSFVNGHLLSVDVMLVK